jgi:hypothetical protein
VLHGVFRIGQRELDPLGQCLAQRLGGLRAAVRGNHRVVVGQRALVGRDGLEERAPRVAARLGIVLEQFVVRRQAQFAQHRQRRTAQQAGKPRVEGAELHRPAAFEQAPVQALQAWHGGLRCGGLDTTDHEFVHQFFGRALGEVFEPHVEALAHLAGGLLGEGDGQDLVRLAGRFALFQQRAKNARDQHPGLARAGASLHGDRTARVAGDGIEGLALDVAAVVFVGGAAHFDSSQKSLRHRPRAAQ